MRLGLRHRYDDRARMRGAYYTPSHVAAAICNLAVRPGDKVLDPACGDGAFLRAASERGASVTGYEIDPQAAKTSGASTRDFFRVVLEAASLQNQETFDVVVGNPPYVHFSASSDHRLARQAATACGIELSSAASTWATFVVASPLFLRPSGRLALIVPREIMFADYARPIITHLRRRFRSVQIISIARSVFSGVFEKVALLLCSSDGPGFSIIEIDALEKLEAAARSTERCELDSDALSWHRIPRNERGAVRRAFARLRPLTEFAEVRAGVVTGDKRFFLTQGIDLPTLPAVASPTWIRGAILKPDDLNGRPRLLDVPADYPGGNQAIDEYLAEGRKRAVHRRFKCAERKCWWRPHFRELPHALLSYLCGGLPRFALNAAQAFPTNNVHKVFIRQPLSTAAFYNPATLLSVELAGRILGDGALRIEPRDARRILVPATRRDPLRHVDAALRARDERAVFKLAGEASGLSRTDLETCARVYLRLRQTRLQERHLPAV